MEIDLIELLIEKRVSLSKAEARRVVAQGGVKLNGTKVTTKVITINEVAENSLKIGKHKEIKL